MLLFDMGGNNFKNSVRINIQNINPTIEYIANLLDNLIDADYLKNNLMGSAGKQDTSGDLDFAIDYSLGVSLHQIADKLRKNNIEVDSKGIKGGQLITLIPIVNQEGFIQTDFIYGNAEWLKFSHWSPGLYVSPYKGVWISTLIGVLAKETRIAKVMYQEEELAKIGWYYDLEKGLHKKWKLKLRHNQGPSFVSADEFETKYPTVLARYGINQEIPRESRVGYIDNPNDVLRILFGTPVQLNEVDTFEKMWKIIVKTFDDVKVRAIEEKFVLSMQKSSGAKSFDIDNWNNFKEKNKNE